MISGSELPLIRSSISSDKDAICSLHACAFGDPEGPVISRLVAALLSDPTAEPRWSLVTEENDQLTGHVIFSAVHVGEVVGSIMAPLAISPNSQGKGLGTALINHGFDLLRKNAVPFVLVLGDPKYYTRFGFSADHNIDPPHKLPYPDAWMAVALQAGALSKVSGVAHCADALMPPEHW